MADSNGDSNLSLEKGHSKGRSVSLAAQGQTLDCGLPQARPGTYQEDGEGVRIHGVLLSRAVTDHAYTGNAQSMGQPAGDGYWATSCPPETSAIARM